MAVQIENKYTFNNSEGAQISPTSFSALTPMASATLNSTTEAVDVVGRSQLSFQMDWGGGTDPSAAKWEMDATIDGFTWVAVGAADRDLNKLHVYTEDITPYSAVRFRISVISGDDDVEMAFSLS